MRFAELARTSAAVAETSARSAKVAELAACLRRLGPEEIRKLSLQDFVDLRTARQPSPRWMRAPTPQRIRHDVHQVRPEIEAQVVA